MINKKLINFKTKEEFLKAKGQIYDWSIVFIDDTREIWTHQTGFQSLPEGGKEDQVLAKTEDGYEWKDNTIVTDEDETIIPELRLADIENENVAVLVDITVEDDTLVINTL